MKVLYLADMDGTTYFGASCKWHANCSHITRHCVTSCSCFNWVESYFAGASQHQLNPDMLEYSLNCWCDPCGLLYWEGGAMESFIL